MNLAPDGIRFEKCKLRCLLVVEESARGLLLTPAPHDMSPVLLESPWGLPNVTIGVTESSVMSISIMVMLSRIHHGRNVI